MTECVTLYHPLPAILEIVHEMRQLEYQQGVDFDFSYVPPTYNGYNQLTPKHTQFHFYNQMLASWFAMKFC